MADIKPYLVIGIAEASLDHGISQVSGRVAYLVKRVAARPRGCPPEVK